MELRREEVLTDTNAAASHKVTGGHSTQPSYRSFKKKFRKTKIKFDEAIQQNKELFFDEQRAVQTAKRLAFQIDQILDMLFDVNNSAHVPEEKRIDLTIKTPCLPEIPPLVSQDDLLKISELQSSKGKALYKEICDMIAARDSLKPRRTPQKSLAFLMSTTHHLSSNNPHLPLDLLTSIEPEECQHSYLTPDQIDEFYQRVDTSRGDFLSLPRIPAQESLQDPVFGNLHSPYNWLRRNVPQIFLQDSESSEKLSGKPGALRGAGKRVNIPAPSKPDSLEIVEEDGLGYDFNSGTSKEKEKKRKREEDVVGHANKRGVEDNKVKRPRQTRKKKSEGSDEKTVSTNNRKSRKPKVPSPSPDAHPFGPT
ncbi:hypothetical protein GcM1_248051 [Golovinomyces cichoracearum]|uniref:IEC3 subunit of the Ino80 complex, chromatin re-modelling-domain-containing protein n=1 Tax=Golovinomyces cichoracearum TaxID=62708 RepID=A0A420ICN5_9PEZI|nr:hypothetical protein GcM1_248051 [Golovinomyces cichoracearum]